MVVLTSKKNQIAEILNTVKAIKIDPTATLYSNLPAMTTFELQQWERQTARQLDKSQQTLPLIDTTLLNRIRKTVKNGRKGPSLHCVMYNIHQEQAATSREQRPLYSLPISSARKTMHSLASLSLSMYSRLLSWPRRALHTNQQCSLLKVKTDTRKLSLHICSTNSPLVYTYSNSVRKHSVNSPHTHSQSRTNNNVLLYNSKVMCTKRHLLGPKMPSPFSNQSTERNCCQD